MSETTTVDQTLPPSLQPGYQPPLPASLQPPPRSSLYQLAGAPAAPSEQSTPEPRNYTVTGTGPGTWWSRQQQPPGQWRDRPDVQQQPQPPAPQPQPPSPVALNRPPAFQQGHQPGPWPAAYPNSPRFDPAQAPPLPGETPQETADLNKFMAHETGNRGNIINDWAARDPSRYYQGQTCQGYWQITNSTWRDGAQRAGVDLRQYPTALPAPYEVQRAVALALYRSYGGRPWAVPPGAGERGDRFALRPQQPPPAEPRDYRSWGQDVRDDASLISAPPRDFGPGPSGQGGLGQPPQESGWVRVLNGVGPLLVGIASLALRMPLSTAITAAGAMARAQDNGQREAYERARTRMQDQLKEANAQQTLESREASDAFVEYGNNNPAGLQQTLAQIALRYNDPIMYRMAERGDLNGIHQLQQRRDLYNQDLTRANKAADEEQKRRDVAADVAARDAQWDKEHPNGTPEERAVAHAQHVGEALRDVGGRVASTPSETQGPILNVIDKTTGKPTGQQVVRNREGTGYRDANTGQPVTLKPTEEVQEIPRQQQPKPAPPANPYVQPAQQDQDQQDQGQQDQGQPDQAQPDQTSPDQGAAPQAPAGPVQTAAAAPPAQAAAPAPAAPYQVAQAGSGVQPPPSSARPAQTPPGMGPRMSALNEDGRRLARDYAMNGNEALQDVPAAFRTPLIQAGQELRSEMEEAAQSGLTGKDLDKRLHQIDPTFADYLRGVSTYTNDLPTPGRTGTSGGRIMALSIAGKLNPNFSEQNLRAQQDFRRPGGVTQRTLSRAAIMAESGRQVREYLKALPADPGLQRWQRAWDQFINNKLVGDHRYSDLFVALRQYIQEANVLVRGGQESVTETGEQLGTREGSGGLFGGAAFAMPGNATPGMILGLLKTDARNVMARMDNFRNQWRQQDGQGEMPGDDAGAYQTFKEFGQMDVDKEAGVASDSDIEKFLGR